MIKNGDLKVGAKMPTERELSVELNVSRNTISTAYNELEQDGVLISYQGKGTFIAEEGKSWEQQDVKNKIIKFVDLGLEEALECGISPDEFLDIVNQRVNEKKDLLSKITAVYVECNIEQSKMFSKQLSSSTNMNVIPLTLNDLKNMTIEVKSIIGKAQIIIATFNHVNEVKALINRDILGVAITPNLETIVKIARYPQNTKFGFLCISEEFKFKIQGALHEAGLGELNIYYSNTNDKKEIQKIVEESEVLIVSPGRYKEINQLNNENKDIIEFIYSLDDGSVKALKSKIIEMKYQMNN